MHYAGYAAGNKVILGINYMRIYSCGAEGAEIVMEIFIVLSGNGILFPWTFS